MKKIFFQVVIIFVAFLTACSKKSDTVIIPPASSDTVKLSTLFGTWQLTGYTIETDDQYYYFNGEDINSHAFRTFIFSNGNYEAANNEWSGTYEHRQSDREIVLTPLNTGFVPMTLMIDYLLTDQLHLSSPRVSVNPENPNATDYEKFVAAQALSWLYNRNVDTSNVQTVRIGFDYFLKERN